MKWEFKKARFLTSAASEKGYPVVKDPKGEFVPEIAVAGRSNVGKSSLLNYLFQSKGLVKTSSKPGKTQCLNFFSVDDALLFVDLPGYGYAEVPLETRKKWGPMIQGYLENRPSLKLLLFLFDIRRDPTPEDMLIVEWARKLGKQMVFVLTKVDKVTRNEKAANVKKILSKLSPDEKPAYVTVSTLKREGRLELIGAIKDCFNAFS